MSMDAELAALARVPLFSSLADAERRLIVLIGSLHRFRPGEALVTAGEAGTWAYVILDGEADVASSNGGPDARHIATLGMGAMVGEIGLLRNIARTATVTARSEVAALRLEQEAFLALLRERPEIAIELCRALATKLQETTEKLA